MFDGHKRSIQLNLVKSAIISAAFVLTCVNDNKTGLQPVSRPVEQVHYFGGWVECAKSLWCPMGGVLLRYLGLRLIGS